MIIKGAVEEIIFRNSENGYTVLNMDNGGRFVTAVGVFPMVAEGEYLALTGEFTLNSKYGEQFSVKEVAVAQPTSKESIFRYLASGLFRGIGEVLAERIVDYFDKDSLSIIEFTPAKLAEVKGISLKKAIEIGDSFSAISGMRAAIFFLQGLDVSINMAIKIYKIYDEHTEAMVKENPYRLIEDVDGIGFITADKIAEKMGVKSNGRFRITAGVLHILKEIVAKGGHTYLPIKEVYVEVKKLLILDEEGMALLSDVLQELEISGKIVSIESESHTAIMISKFYMIEKSIATRLVAMLADNADIHLDIARDIANFELVNGVTLHAGQVDAIENCIKYGVNVVTGGPGTGKTTIIKCIISILQSKGMKVILCAPTGRAAKRLNEATGCEAKTIHRLLDLDFKNGKGNFSYNEHTSLEADIVIVDEVSMCDEHIFNSLIKAVKYGGRLIMVGDKDQLPSVGAGNVLSDIIQCGVVPVSYLTQIYRQAEESLIIKNAHLINKGRMPVLDDIKKDFFFDQKAEQPEILKSSIGMVTERIPKFLNTNVKNIQVLCPMKKGICGVENLNVQLQESINPLCDGKKELRHGVKLFREGDKVIHMVNNYQMEWSRNENGFIEMGQGVFNGDIGYITRIANNEISVMFEDLKVAKYTSADFDELKLAYAISVHKSQGSEFDVVILPIVGGAYTICTRNLLYTAVTRAKKMVVVIGDKRNIEIMVKNNYTQKRYSLLKEFIIEEYRRRGGE